MRKNREPVHEFKLEIFNEEELRKKLPLFSNCPVSVKINEHEKMEIMFQAADDPVERAEFEELRKMAFDLFVKFGGDPNDPEMQRESQKRAKKKNRGHLRRNKESRDTQHR